MSDSGRFEPLAAMSIYSIERPLEVNAAVCPCQTEAAAHS